MASADFSLRLAASPFQARGEISPGITHLPSRLCLSDIRHVVRASTGLWQFWLPHPNVPPRIRFLFVRPAFCLGLPPDVRSPETHSPLANSSPCRVSRGLSPPSRCALPGAPKKEAAEAASFKSRELTVTATSGSGCAASRRSAAPPWSLCDWYCGTVCRYQGCHPARAPW